MALKGSKVVLALFLIQLFLSPCVLSTSSLEDSKCGCTTPKTPPTPMVSPPTPKPTLCPIDTLKLGVCADLLGGLVNVVLGTPPVSPCCTLLSGLVDADVGLCLCTAIKANVLGVIKLDIPVALSLLVNACGKSLPDGFKCS